MNEKKLDEKKKIEFTGYELKRFRAGLIKLIKAQDNKSEAIKILTTLNRITYLLETEFGYSNDYFTYDINSKGLISSYAVT